MKNKFNTATFLRQLALTLLVAMLAAAFQPARAQDSYPEYITEVIVVGGSGNETNTAKKTYEEKGYTFCNQDLNDGSGGAYIYLGYKKASRANTNGGYITDFKLMTYGSKQTNLSDVTVSGTTYTLCPVGGGTNFCNAHGDVNYSTGGEYIYLYYTKENFSDKRAVSGIKFISTDDKDANNTNYVFYGNQNNSADFNQGAEGPHIYMQLTTATKSNRPSNDPVMASGLTFNGSAQTLLSINNTNTGTMMYSVNDGSFSSTIPTATDAGTYTVKYYAASNNYGDQSETKSQTVSIAKANNNKVTTTAAHNLTYNGSAQNLINAYSATFGTIQYSLDGTNYSATVPQGKDAKTYTIYYKVEGTSNYNGVSGTATATIKKAANNNATVSIANSIDGTGNVNPTVDNNLSTGTITYQYSKSSNGGFSTNKPNTSGTWYVKATIATDDNYDAYTTDTKSFTINWEGDGTSSSKYLIKSTADLDLLAQRVNAGNNYKGKYFSVENDIKYTGTSENYTPIGNGQTYFYGNFYGNGKVISGIRIKSYAGGLFGVIGENGHSENVIVSDLKNEYTGNNSCGGIAGSNHGYINYCTAINVSFSCQYSAAICVFNNTGKYGLDGNYYINCTANGKTTNIGTYAGDVANAKSLHTLSLGTNITTSTIDTKTYNNTKYYAQGTEITLNYSGTIPEGALLYYTINDGEPTTSNKFTMPAQNTTVAAAVEQYYTITLGEGISITSPASPALTSNGIDYYAQGTVLTLSYASGKHFLANGNLISGTSYTMPKEDVTFTPCYFVNYTLDGGTLPSGIDNPTIYTSGTLTLPTPTRDYYTFDGWYQGNTKITSISGITADITLTAKWTLTEYKITYNLNDGTLPDGTANPTTYTVESSTITLPTPTRNYYDFDGWYDSDNFEEGNVITTIDPADTHADVELYAKWTPMTITEIHTTDDLIAFSNTVNAGNNYSGIIVTLNDHIDFNPTDETTNNFTAIGTEDHPFSGTFDGQGHTISGIRINTESTRQGLFGMNEGVIKNLTIDNAVIVSKWQRVGGIAGVNKGTISNCVVTNDVKLTADKGCGGVAGTNTGYGTISNCVVTNNVVLTTKNEYGWLNCGGIAGFNDTRASLSNNLVIGATIIANDEYYYYGAIVGTNGGTLQNNFYYNTTVNGASTEVGCNGADIEDQNGAVHLDLLIDGESTESVSVAPGTYQKVLYRRNITAGIPTTIMLPFNFDASAFGGGKFYTFTGINAETWEATMTETTSTLSANAPYIYIADKNMTSVVFAGVTIEKTEAGKVEKTDWTFQGTYEKKVWNTNGEIETKNVYGFAAKAGKNQDGESYAAGEFVRARYNISIKPTRAYLQYTGNDVNLSKSAIVLPDRIKVVFIDKETASVIDDPTVNPSENEDGDITTPTSEIQPTANVKVWSYDKTIFIQARPGTDYRIIDANGRTLRTATTQTDRDEIRLGSRSGIAIVIINGKTFKVIY
ncbi:MAG: InlB B-repeat-containing protein [Bacteroidales bacterium]|nr:InlB B-repeat-containing protein [Bacteroidales bacterium]